MPNLVVSDAGLKVFLSRMLTGLPPILTPYQVVLWVNDFFPVSDAPLSAFSEATFGGYERKTLAAIDWAEPTVASGCASTENGTAPLAWTVGPLPSETLYGYLVLDPTTSDWLWAQRFDFADIAPLIAGQIVRFLPLATLTSAACAGIHAKLKTTTPRKRKDKPNG